MDDCEDSDHLLIYNLYKHIENNKNSAKYDIRLFNDITRLYDNQIDKMERIFNKRNVKIEDISKKEMAHNIICSFNYGLSNTRSFKTNDGFKFNGMTCDLSKSLFKYNKYSSIVFYSNLFINGKLNVTIVSPWKLD